jgi:hypothetical protein
MLVDQARTAGPNWYRLALPSQRAAQRSPRNISAKQRKYNRFLEQLDFEQCGLGNQSCSYDNLKFRFRLLNRRSLENESRSPQPPSPIRRLQSLSRPFAKRARAHHAPINVACVDRVLVVPHFEVALKREMSVQRVSLTLEPSYPSRAT